MPTCAFPLCNRHAEKNGYCVGHRIYAADQAGGKSNASKPKPEPGEKKNPVSGSKQSQKSSPAGSASIKKS